MANTVEINQLQKEHLIKLCEALESGKFKQGFRTMRYEDCYCPLGVACDITKTESHTQWRFHKSKCHFRIGGESAVLPDKIAKLFGLDRWGTLPNRLSCKHGLSVDITQINDVAKLPFHDIARVIRIQFLGENLPYPDGVSEVAS